MVTNKNIHLFGTQMHWCADSLNCKHADVHKLPLSPDLIQCTNEMNVNIPQLADTLFERTTNTSWVVVFKSLITTQHLMVYGNEVSNTQTRFTFNTL